MIRYTPTTQLTIEEFETPFAQKLDPDNRWVKLATLIPWDDLASAYSKNLQHVKGRFSVDVRLVIGAMIIKHKLNISDRETVNMIAENIYLQYFCGFQSFQSKRPFDSSLFVSIRKRMGGEVFDKFNDYVIERSEALKKPGKRVMQKQDDSSKDEDKQEPNGNKGSATGKSPSKPSETQSTDDTPNKGKLKIDATVADQYIKYPTDLGLLNTCREESERLIDLLHSLNGVDKKPRTYRRKARQAYLSVAKKRKKTKREIRKAIGRQLRYLRRNLQNIERQLDNFTSNIFPLEYREQRIYWVLQHIYEQQQYMYANHTKRHDNRIVNVYQPYVRPIVRGKDKSRIEFGAKINISEYGGMCKVDHIGWDAYNESLDLPDQAERYRRTFGCYPELVLADKIYLTRSNRAWLKARGIRTVGKPLGRPKKTTMTAYERKKLKDERNERNHVEGKIGQAKNGYGLNQIRAKRQDTSESWIQAIHFIMNLQTLMELSGKYFLFLLSGIQKQWMHMKVEMRRYDVGILSSTRTSLKAFG